MKEGDKHFTYKEGLIPSSFFDSLYIEIYDKLIQNAQRRSCLFNLHPIVLNAYEGYLPTYNYEKVPKIIHDIRTIIEKDSNQIFDFVLVHLYVDGNVSIGWHADSEAKQSEIASVSLGATRKFRLRKFGKTIGWDHEFRLKSGDCIYMHGSSKDNNFQGCQKVYQHTIPKELTIKQPRINLTFRQYEI